MFIAKKLQNISKMSKIAFCAILNKHKYICVYLKLHKISKVGVIRKVQSFLYKIVLV